MEKQISHRSIAQSKITHEVIRLAKAGDKVAMSQIYQVYAPSIYNLLYRMLWRREIAQELMQDTFIDVLKNLASYRAEAGLYAWIRKIAVNRCLMHFRKNKAVMVEFNSQSEPLAQVHSEIHFDAEKMLQKLTPKRRMLVWLHEVEGMTHKEIAQLMGKSISSSKTELSRALAQLRELTNLQTSSEKSTANQNESSEKAEVALCTPLLNNS